MDKLLLRTKALGISDNVLSETKKSVGGRQRMSGEWQNLFEL